MGNYFSSGSSNATPEQMDEVRANVNSLIQQDRIVIFSKSHCPYCITAKKVFDGMGKKYQLIELNGHPQASMIQDIMLEITGERTVPRVFIDGQCIGGGTETSKLYKSGQLQKMLG